MSNSTGVAFERPRQAVILAGGRGMRLRPLTETRPKPMIEFHGRPFLEYLIEMLRDQGFERFLLLLGYLPEAISGYFGDGRPLGVEIEYALSGVEDDTGRRLKLAAPMIEPRFLLAYCDNYWPMPFADMWDAYRAGGAMAQVAVYRNRDGYTRGNLSVGADGFVDLYDKQRAATGLAGVDIGFLIAERAVLDLLPEDLNPSFEAAVYPRLVAARQLRAFETDHRYYSVGTIERLDETGRFLARPKTILVDRDGVLNRKARGGRYVTSWRDWRWLPGALDALRLLAESGYRVIVVTNQSGIARSFMTLADLEAIHERMLREAAAAGGRIDAVYHCPHDWDEGCWCRKPAPGMLFQAQRDFALDLSRTLFVGDDPRDGEAARRAGAPFAMVEEGTGLLDIVARLIADPAHPQERPWLDAS
ncbi:MAG: HAD-IIIA family hydrolase [Pseudomonadota bacterium]